jgi:hypothetical protein
MSLSKKTPQTAKGGADPKDEIEQIMSEIELLQKEIGQVEAEAPAAPAPRQAQPAARPKPTLVKSEGPKVETSIVETDPLEEFRASGGGEPSLEDTLADLRDDGGSGGGVLGALDEETEPEMGDLSSPDIDREEALARAEREVEEAFDDDGDAELDSRQLEEIHEEEIENSISTSISEDDPMSHDEDKKTGDGSLSMTLRGNMTLKLQYEIEGQAITIGFTGDAMRVQLADGTEFKIPIRRGARRAA